MTKMVKLKAPQYVSSVGYGTTMYPVENGVLEVPQEVADSLLLSHKGYAEIKSAPKLDATVAKKA